MLTCPERWFGPNWTSLAARCVRGVGAAHLLLAGCMMALAWCAEGARAQEPEAPLRVVVLRGSEGDVSGELAKAVDAAMLRDLAQIAGIEDPAVSPIDLAEIGLTVGCSDTSRPCLVAIAQMLEVDAVVVRRLVVNGSHARLRLAWVDPRSSAEPVLAEREVARAEAQSALPLAVPVLVRVLFGIPEPVEAAPVLQRSPKADEAGSRIGVLTWVALAVGTGTLAAGFAMGVSAQSEFDHYKALPVATRMDAERADQRFDTVESRASIANVLMPVGAGLLALGGVLLVLDLRREPSRPALALQPARGGLLLSVRATSGGL